jgi:hypothetical protein
LAAVFVAVTAPAAAQYPGHTQKTDDKKPAPPRAISVLEWVGDQNKPKASRIVPVTVFVNGQYQDGGLYLARPAPLTVESGTAYEVQKAGVPQGFYDLNRGANVGGSWFGFGDWRPLNAPKPPKKMPPSKNPPHVIQDNDPDRPHFKTDSTAAGPTGGQPSGSPPSSAKAPQTSPQTTDANSPTLHKRTNDSSGDNGSSTSNADDPDKPTLHRHADSSGDTGSSGAGNAPDDPDRPHMKKSADANAASTVNDTPSIGAANEDDPDRPKLSRGQPAPSEKNLAATQLNGLPPELQQMVAVSDALSREEHPFAYQWANPDDAMKMKAAVEALAIKAVLPVSEPPPPKTTAPAAPRPGAPRSTLAHRMPVKPPPVTLSDEDFRAYELSYGGGATLVLTATAHIGPTNAGITNDKYVTIIAQPDFESVPQIRMQSVTTQADLDITPQMRLVDAVDTDGDNRAELIFELRRTSDRQFAIYRLHGTKAEQAFATESLPYGSPTRVEIKLN